MEWQPIETAPKDGRSVYVRRVHGGKTAFEGEAQWRTVVFPAFSDGCVDEPAYTATGWMRVGVDKRFPEPTHWMPLPPPPPDRSQPHE